jgi:hypothetical protein
MNCDIDAIIADAGCLLCLTPGQIAIIRVQLLCELLALAPNLTP